MYFFLDVLRIVMHSRSDEYVYMYNIHTYIYIYISILILILILILIYIHVYYVIISKYDYVCIDIHVHNPTRWATNLFMRRLVVLPYICMKNIEDIG